MAVFSLSALLVLLGVIAVSATQPWGVTSVVPQLRLAPDLGAALGDAVGVAPSAGGDLADARPASAGGPALAAATGVQQGQRGAGPQVGIAGARPVAHSAPATAPTAPSEPVAPVPAPTQPTPVAVPVSTHAPASSPDQVPKPPPAVVTPDTGRPAVGGDRHGPTTAGVDLDLPFASFQVEEGGAYLLSSSFELSPTVFRPPGDANLLVQFNGAGALEPSFGLQLWDDGLSGRGLWSSGEAMGGERFLAPLAEEHELELYFQASSEAAGFYLAFLDGEPIDARVGVGLIAPGSDRATVEVGLFRDGEFVSADAELVFLAANIAGVPELP